MTTRPPRETYSMHKSNARSRGIPFDLTFEEPAAFLDKPRGPALGLEWCWRSDVFTPYAENDDD